MSPTIHAFDANLPRPLGYRNTGVISISASKDEVHHESVPSQRLVSFWSHLPRYPQGCLVPCPHIEIDVDFATELLCSPEPNDPQDAEVAKHYMTSKTSFEETATYWTHIYAGDAKQLNSGDDVAIAGLEHNHVDRFVELGFPKAKVVDALRRLNYRGNNTRNIPDDRVIENYSNDNVFRGDVISPRLSAHTDTLQVPLLVPAQLSAIYTDSWIAYEFSRPIVVDLLYISAIESHTKTPTKVPCTLGRHWYDRDAMRIMRWRGVAIGLVGIADLTGGGIFVCDEYNQAWERTPEDLARPGRKRTFGTQNGQNTRTFERFGSRGLSIYPDIKRFFAKIIQGKVPKSPNVRNPLKEILKNRSGSGPFCFQKPFLRPDISGRFAEGLPKIGHRLIVRGPTFSVLRLRAYCHHRNRSGRVQVQIDPALDEPSSIQQIHQRDYVIDRAGLAIMVSEDHRYDARDVNRKIDNSAEYWDTLLQMGGSHLDRPDNTGDKGAARSITSSNTGQPIPWNLKQEFDSFTDVEV
ncbi:ubiquitin-conjugating enzyme e2-24 kDa [Salix suchowensis]|nr:ubiquitin-conjugating enzyme e2-24 kDa [Salix suchowensis]